MTFGGADGCVQFFGDPISTVYTWRHKLAGLVRVNGVPARRRILVIGRFHHDYKGATWSDPVTGEWSIEGMAEYPERSLLVIVFDDLQKPLEYNAEVLDYVSQVATE